MTQCIGLTVAQPLQFLCQVMWNFRHHVVTPPDFDAADMLSHYFGGKLAEFSQATTMSTGSHGSDEEEEAEAMDVSRSPEPAACVMGQQWAHRTQQVLTFLQQLGLQVCNPARMPFNFRVLWTCKKEQWYVAATSLVATTSSIHASASLPVIGCASLYTSLRRCMKLRSHTLYHI